MLINLRPLLILQLDTGMVEENGEGEGEGFNINIPLPPGSGYGAYDCKSIRIRTAK